MPDGPDVRALTYLLSAEANGHRPMSCRDCPFALPYLVAGGRVLCDLMADGTVIEPDRPLCTSGHWGERARTELAALQSDNALLAVVARDAREESLMYSRGLAEGKTAEREACCQAVCSDCVAGLPAWRDVSGWWTHNTPEPGVPYRRCRADAIRRRAAGDGR